MLINQLSCRRYELATLHKRQVDLIKQKRATSEDHLFCSLMGSTGRLPLQLQMASMLPEFFDFLSVRIIIICFLWLDVQTAELSCLSGFQTSPSIKIVGIHLSQKIEIRFNLRSFIQISDTPLCARHTAKTSIIYTKPVKPLFCYSIKQRKKKQSDNQCLLTITGSI